MKNNKFKHICILLLCSIYCSMLFAIPAKSGLISTIQKDRRLLDLYLFGDEFLSFAKTTDDYTILPNTDGNYYYAVLDANGNMVCSEYLAANPELRTGKENKFLSKTKKNISFSPQQRQQSNERKSKQMLSSNFPTTGNNPLLIILVDFPDRAFSCSREDFENLANQTGYSVNGGTGCLREYYSDNSFNQLNLIPTVVGPYTLSHNMAYYGAQEGSDVDIRPQLMAYEAVKLADSLGGIDFTQFDVNNDNIIDAIHIIFAGLPQSSSAEADAIWPHRWFVVPNDSINPYFDGKQMKDYSCSGEKRGHGIMDGIGTICHEFGHVLGLPDFYDTDYEGSGGNCIGLSSWSTMASGSYNNNGSTPPIFNANERSVLGWMSLDTLSIAGTYTAYALNDSNSAFMFTTSDTDDYYIIENRKRTGWDTYLPNNGLLIYHIKESYMGDNCLNCNPEFQKCDIVEADNDSYAVSLARDVFTDPAVNNYFTNYNTPYCFKWSDMSKVDKPITQITMDSLGNVSFRYCIPDTNAIVKTAGHQQNSDISYTLKGELVYEGIGQNPQKGFIFADNNAMNNFSFYSATSMTDNIFSETISNLNYSQTYYYKAVLIVANGDTIFGTTNNFTTNNGQPSLLLHPITTIGLDSLVISVSKTADGAFPITEYGFVYDSISTLDTSSNKISFNGDFSTASATLSNLEQNTKYYVKAYVITNLGVRYSTSVHATTRFIPIENNTIQAFEGTKCYGESWDNAIGSEPTGGKGNFNYLWQIKSSRNGSWTEADSINNARDYEIGTPEATIWLRRLVFSYNIKDTSNEIKIDIKKSNAGKIYGKDSLSVASLDTLILKNYSGTLLSWYVNDENLVPVNFLQNSDTISFSSDVATTINVIAEVQDSTCPIASTEKIVVFHDNESCLNNVAETLNNINITPNPAKDFVVVSAQQPIHCDMALIDMQGKEILTRTNINTKEFKLNVAELKEGTYILHLFNTKNSIQKKLIIKR